MDNVKIGTKLIAISNCEMEHDNSIKALIIGKEYEITDTGKFGFSIVSELSHYHFFKKEEILKYFKFKTIKMDKPKMTAKRKGNNKTGQPPKYTKEVKILSKTFRVPDIKEDIDKVYEFTAKLRQPYLLKKAKKIKP